MTASPAMRRYAAEIYRLQQDHEQVSLSLLSSHVESSAQAISTMVKRLNKNGYPAHELSDVFERGVNDEIEDRMDELAGHPTRCPHGEPIPSKDGVIPKIEDMPLVDVPSGSDCVVSRVRTHNMEELHYIAELGLVPGTPFHLLSCAPFKGPLRLQMKPQDHIIGYELSQSIWVEVNKLGEGNKLPPLKTPYSKSSRN